MDDRHGASPVERTYNSRILQIPQKRMFTYLFVIFLLAMVMTKLWLAARQVRHVVAHRAAVPERFLNVVKKDQPVSLWIDASSRPHSGAISRVSPAVDVNGRTFVVEMTFANARHELKPGGFGRGEITVGQRTDVTTIPPQALYSFAGLDKVFTIKDGKVVATVVKVVAKNDQRVVIEGSLGGADQVIVSGLAHLANGDPV